MRELEQAAHEAMILCFHDYRKIAGQWLWKAPEYLLTTYLYQGLAGKSLAARVRPEHSIEDLLYKADIRGRGPAPGDLRHNGRADLSFWDEYERPTGLIEVKCPVSAYCALEGDHKRVESIFRRHPDRSSIRFAGLAFYVDQCDGACKEAGERVSNYVASIRGRFGCDHPAQSQGCSVQNGEYKIQSFVNTDKDVTFSCVLTDVREEESTWATCLVLWHR